MNELLKVLNLAPTWTLYTLIGTAFIKVMLSIIQATPPVTTSSKAQRALKAAGLMTNYFLCLIAIFAFMIANINKIPLAGLLAFAAIAIPCLLVLAWVKYAEKHPDPTPRTARTSSGRNPEKDQKLPRYLSAHPRHAHAARSLRKATIASRKRRAPRS